MSTASLFTAVANRSKDSNNSPIMVMGGDLSLAAPARDPEDTWPSVLLQLTSILLTHSRTVVLNFRPHKLPETEHPQAD